MSGKFGRKILLGGVTLTVAALAACAPKPAPPPPPPPPPPVAKPVVVIPPRPRPPMGSPEGMSIPALTADGVFISVNRNITPAQTIWNLRAAYNVAALNCSGSQRDEITVGYRAFLKTHAKGLATANRKVDAEFKARHGSGYVARRESYLTEVYNHFALPPTLRDFCNAVAAVNRDAQTVKPAELESFSIRSLPNVEIVFDEFYRRYSTYRTDLASWEARYGGTTTAVAGPQ